MMPNLYADTAEALEDVAVSASEALGAVVSFRVYNFLLKTGFYRIFFGVIY
jgi:hypothetical protein